MQINSFFDKNISINLGAAKALLVSATHQETLSEAGQDVHVTRIQHVGYVKFVYFVSIKIIFTDGKVFG